jgi:hypothetical protein
MEWLAENRPDLVERYRRLYQRGAYAPESERRRLAALVRGPNMSPYERAFEVRADPGGSARLVAGGHRSPAWGSPSAEASGQGAGADATTAEPQSDTARARVQERLFELGGR